MRQAITNRLLIIVGSTAAIIALNVAAVDALSDPPGADPYPAKLRNRLETTLLTKGPDYDPRSEHRLPDGRPVFTNRLIFEASPYLVQHAHNPVNWYAWGEEALETAKREQKPIFLSIGYSTCHWCHVMERESFDNVEIARLMNSHFVSIKVDRERRPDLDELYMSAVVLTTGRGGWPMSSFLTPEGKPFFGGTYFPPAQFERLLRRISELWETQRTEVVAQAEDLTNAVRKVTAARGTARRMESDTVQGAVAELVARHDPLLGGFSDAPKFPNEPALLLLLESASRRGDADALAAAETSLLAMANGGIHDQVGGGFHRYATDPNWLVPHFEKMLYNQAQLARAYLRAYRITSKPIYARVTLQILDFVLSDMTSPQGSFYAAIDADSAGKEGGFYIWTLEEIQEPLSEEDAELAIALYGVTSEGNFEGSNILHLPVYLEEYAHAHDLDLPVLVHDVDQIRKQLRTYRNTRPHPIRDDKIVTAWNAMMITALAEATEILTEERYLATAQKAAKSVWKTNRLPDGELSRAYLDGVAAVAAGQEDYAYLGEAFATLYDASGDPVWLARAQDVADMMLAKFWDDQGGGFFMSSQNTRPLLIARPKSVTDGAIPSGNSVAVRMLAMLASRTGDQRYADKAHQTLASFASSIEQARSAYAYMLFGADELFHGAVGERAYGARGNVIATARLAQHRKLASNLVIRDSWHINAHEPSQKELIATTLTLADGTGPWRLAPVRYPSPDIVKLAFSNAPLGVYQGRITLSTEVIESAEDTGEKPLVLPLRLHIQACNNEMCLPPEVLVMELPGTRVERVHWRGAPL